MNTNKFVEGLKKVDWIGVGVTVVGIAGLVLNGKQKQQEAKQVKEAIDKQVKEAINNLK